MSIVVFSFVTSVKLELHSSVEITFGVKILLDFKPQL